MDISSILKNLGEVSPQLASTLIIVVLYGFLIKQRERDQARQDKKDEMQTKKDEIHIATLTLLQANVAEVRADLKENWSTTKELANVTKGIAENVSKQSQALSSIKCLTNNQQINAS